MPPDNQKKVRVQVTGDGVNIDQIVASETAQPIVGALLGATRAVTAHIGAVDMYCARWDFNTHQGQVDIRVIAPTAYSWGFLATLKPTTPDEMCVLLQLLSSGQKLVFNQLTQMLVSGDMPELPPSS